MSEIYYTPIFQVRDSDGNIQDVLGLRGQSAWDLAKEAGYEGSVWDFSQA